MMARVSIAARDSLRVTGRSILSFSERSDAVRKALPPATCTRLTPRPAYISARSASRRFTSASLGSRSASSVSSSAWVPAKISASSSRRCCAWSAETTSVTLSEGTFSESASDISLPLLGPFTQIDRAEALGLSQFHRTILGKLQGRHEGRAQGRAAARRIGEAGRQEGFERLPVDGDAQHAAQPLGRFLDREELRGLDLMGVGALRLQRMAVGGEQVVELHVPHGATHDDNAFGLAAGKDVLAELRTGHQAHARLLHRFEAAQLPLQGVGHLLARRLLAGRRLGPQRERLQIS